MTALPGQLIATIVFIQDLWAVHTTSGLGASLPRRLFPEKCKVCLTVTVFRPDAT
jgi:hypothetical protein